jgi:hypothetical protein
METQKKYKEVARDIDNLRILSSLDFLVQHAAKLGSEDSVGNPIGENELCFLEAKGNLLTPQEVRIIADSVPEAYLKAVFEDLWERVERTVDLNVEEKNNNLKNESSMKNLEEYVNRVTREAALNPDTFSVSHIIAIDKNLTTEELSALAKHDDYNVQRGVAEHQKTLPGTLSELAKSDNEYVREYVASNENTPKEALLFLKKDKNRWVRDMATKTIDTVDVLEQFYGQFMAANLRYDGFSNADLSDENLRVSTTLNPAQYERFRSYVKVQELEHEQSLQEHLEMANLKNKNINYQNSTVMTEKKQQNSAQLPTNGAEQNHSLHDNAVAAAAGINPAIPEGLQPEQELTSSGKKIKGAGGGVDVQKGSSVAEAVVGNFAHNLTKNANATSDREGKPYNGIDPEKVNWDELKKLGVSNDFLQKSGALNDMLEGKKSNLVHIVVKVDGMNVESQARLSFKKNEDGTWGIKANTKKNMQSLQQYFGYQFTDEDRLNFKTTGNLGKVIEVNLPSNPNAKTAVLLSLDKLTNELIARDASKVNAPKSILGVELTPEQQADLKTGKAVRVENMPKKDGSTFSAELQYNANEKMFTFVNSNFMSKINGVELNPAQRMELLDGKKAVRIENMVDKAGKQYSAWVKYTPGRVDKNGKSKNLTFYQNNPNKGEVIAPTVESSVQHAANNEGHKPEALKNVPGALEQGQGADKTPKQVAEVKEQRKQYTPTVKVAADANKKKDKGIIL